MRNWPLILILYFGTLCTNREVKSYKTRELNAREKSRIILLKYLINTKLTKGKKCFCIITKQKTFLKYFGAKRTFKFGV